MKTHVLNDTYEAFFVLIQDSAHYQLAALRTIAY